MIIWVYYFKWFFVQVVFWQIQGKFKSYRGEKCFQKYQNLINFSYENIFNKEIPEWFIKIKFLYNLKDVLTTVF